MRPNNVIILFLAIVMGGIAAFLARNWIESHSRALAAGDSLGTLVVAAKPLGFGAEVMDDLANRYFAQDIQHETARASMQRFLPKKSAGA